MKQLTTSSIGMLKKNLRMQKAVFSSISASLAVGMPTLGMLKQIRRRKFEWLQIYEPCFNALHYPVLSSR